MIAADHRPVVFLDSGADILNVPYILDEFTYFFETSCFDTDPICARCDLYRPERAVPTNRMLIANHMLYKKVGVIEEPDREAVAKTNSGLSLVFQIHGCYLKWSKMPLIVLIDFYNRGNYPADYFNMSGI
jgi:hypothetical protein